MKRTATQIVCSAALMTSAAANGAGARDPARLLADPAMFANPRALAAAHGRTSGVYRGANGGYKFNLHSYLARYQNRFWTVWSSGLVDEDSNGQSIRYASSDDGHRWGTSRILAPDPDGIAGPGFWICRGLFVAGGRLTALLARVDERQPGRWPGLKLMRYEWDGKQWKDAGLFLDDCMNNYPPERLGKHWFMTCRDASRAMFTAVSPDLVNGNWKRTPLPVSGPGQNTSEPSTYVDPEGIAHTLFRDQGRSGFLHHSLSRGDGVGWSAPVRTDYPDATSKNFSGRLSNGWYYLINNPDRKSRDPLAITFSLDGWTFARPLAIRTDGERRTGKARSFQYPHALEHAGSLWVIYSTNKEDVEITELPVAALVPKAK